jgi:hypothetical protein
MSNILHILLHEIGNALNDYLAPEPGKPLTPERIARLLFRLEDLSNPAENIITSILGSHWRLATLAKMLVNRLTRDVGEQEFLETYRSHMICPPEVYHCSLGNLKQTIKEVLDSFQPIEEEMLKLRKSLEARLMTGTDEHTGCPGSHSELEVGILLRMAMQSGCLDV